MLTRMHKIARTQVISQNNKKTKQHFYWSLRLYAFFSNAVPTVFISSISNEQLNNFKDRVGLTRIMSTVI